MHLIHPVKIFLYYWLFALLIEMFKGLRFYSLEGTGTWFIAVYSYIYNINNNYNYHYYLNYYYLKNLSYIYNRQTKMHIFIGQGEFVINPLSPDIKMHILLTDLHTFLMKLVRRICLNIKTSYPEWSLPLFLSLEHSNK